MKKIILVALAAVSFTAANAQSAKLVSANNYLREYSREGDPESLAKAKEAIDLAAENPDTKDQAKTHYYKGQIYLAIFQKNLRLATEKSTEQDPKKKEAAAFLIVPVGDLKTAYDAYSKAKSLDTKGNYTSLIDKDINEAISPYFSNKGSYDYRAKNYTSAMECFDKSYEISGKKDTSLLYNCAIAAVQAADYAKAKEYYNRLIELKVGQSKSYGQLMNVYFMAKDTAGAIDVLKKGRIAYPSDISLLLNETDIYIKTNKSAEALANLNQAIVAKPNDHVLYFARGNMYDNLANPKDAKGKELEKPKDSEQNMKLAEADYKKSLEIKGDYFDALYNLGALYYNNGVVQGNKANTITDQKKYEAEIKLANDEFAKAVTILEKALTVNDKDRATMTALKNIYYRLQMKDKGDAMKERLKNN